MPSTGPEERIGDLWRLDLWRLLRSCRALLSLPVVLSPTLLIRAIWLHESGSSLHNSSVELAEETPLAGGRNGTVRIACERSGSQH